MARCVNRLEGLCDGVGVAFCAKCGEEVGGLGKVSFKVGEPLFESACARFPRHELFF